MITFLKGDLFKSSTQSYVIPVNTVGVMGAGLALYAKKRYPHIFDSYRKACFNGSLSVNGFHVVNIDNNKKIILFPTKTTWKEPSKLPLIVNSLLRFKETYQDYKIESCAFPLLGCGLGQLRHEDVVPVMIEHLIDLPIPIEVYYPSP